MASFVTTPAGWSDLTPPVCVDLYCGLGGWSAGFIAEGYDCIGFDIERHVYGEHRYPGQLVIQDVRTLHGSQFREATCIVASPPCQEYSYMAMPWSRAKKIQAEYRDGTRDVRKLTELFDACFRIQREASEAAGRHIPMVVENVVGAQPWVGRAKWHYGSYYLWGDVPALMPITTKAPKFILDDIKNGQRRQVEGIYHDGVKVGDRNKGRVNGGHVWTTSWDDGVKVGQVRWYPPSDPRHVRGESFNGRAERALRDAERATKNDGGSWFNIGSRGQKVVNQNPVHDGVDSFGWSKESDLRNGNSKSSARKAASARIAKIPPALARHIAQVYADQPSLGYRVHLTHGSEGVPWEFACAVCAIQFDRDGHVEGDEEDDR